MARIFLTGATGFVGGEALFSLYNASPRPHISALVRDAQKGAKINESYPELRIVNGDLDDVSLIEEESSNSDAVFHLASTKHAESSKAIARGLNRKSTPGYWVQMSGASMFSGPDIAEGRYGEASPDVFNDVKDAEKIISIIQQNPARVVDQLVLGQDPSKVKTALVVGPLIYGTGQGPGNTRSIQIPEMAKTTLQRGEGFRVGAGKSAWSNVHIEDLGTYFRSLLEAINSSKSGCWNREGVHLVENGRLSFGEIGEAVAKEAHRQGLIKSGEVTRIFSPEDANEAMPHGAVLWATNAVGVAEREKSILGWQPKHTGPLNTIEEVVKLEAKNLKA